MSRHKHDEHECQECSEFMELITEYLEGEATEAVRQELMMHVQSCKQCARLLWGMERLVQCCRAEPGQEMPAEVREELWQVIIREIHSDRTE